LREVALETGQALRQVNLDDPYFGEGIVVLGDRIIQLTWQSQVAFVYDRADFTRTGEFQYNTEGWGLTFDGDALIMSDGTNTLYFRDPDTFEVLRTIDVFDRGQRVHRLNELEYIAGEVYANVWQTEFIAVIDPGSGVVNGWIDLTDLLDTTAAKAPDVLNGIAYDEENDRLFVTGKNWPRLYEIDLLPRTN
jgi:glutamine cyclotransferase